jgi:hypothetical protein
MKRKPSRDVSCISSAVRPSVVGVAHLISHMLGLLCRVRMIAIVAVRCRVL